jgi:hypothetical protein
MPEPSLNRLPGPVCPPVTPRQAPCSTTGHRDELTEEVAFRVDGGWGVPVPLAEEPS